MSQDEAQRFDFISSEVIAPLVLRFGQAVALRGDKLCLDIDAASTVNLENVGVSVFFLFGDQTVARRRIEVAQEPHEKRDGGVAFSIDVPEVWSGAMSVLTYKDVAVDRQRLFQTASLNKDPRWAVFHAFIGGPQELSEALISAGGGDPFEHAVSILFHLPGLATGHYARSFGGDMAVVFAMSSGEGYCLIVECTVRELDLTSKIAKLVTRAREVEREMPGHEVHPVLVTQQPRRDISAVLREAAAQEKVILIIGDDLGGLVQLATEFPPPDKVRNYFLRLIAVPAQGW